jgi:hypothetical protein
VRGLRPKYVEKLGRADTHLQTLDKQIATFLKRQTDLVASDYEPQAGEKIWWIDKEPDTIPHWWGLLAGEVLYHLKSALDHMAYDLARAEAGEKTEFPICKDTPVWEGILKTYQKGRPGKLHGMRPEAVAIIKDLQPCFRPKGPPDHDPLWYLYDLNRIDKHRYVNLVAASAAGSTLHRPGVPHDFTWFYMGPIEEGTVLCRVKVPPDREMNVQFYPTFDVDFAEPRPGRFYKDYTLPVRYTLWHLWETVGYTLAKLEPHV